MKKYTTLRCSVCARVQDSLINLSHYTTDRCTITLGCEGRLSPIGFTAMGGTQGVPPAGLSNWHPRNERISNTDSASIDEFYNTSTGLKQQIILAVSNYGVGFEPAQTAKVTLNLVAEAQNSKDYRQYVYRKSGPFSVINGVESGAGKKVLRYNVVGTTPDQVEVYIDGVKKTLGNNQDEYQLHTGPASPVPPNSIWFNSQIAGAVISQVDIIVKRQADLTTASLVFDRMRDDEARINSGAWEGVSAVRSPSLIGDWSLFYCDFSDVTLAVDLKLRLNPSTPCTITSNGVIAELDPAHASFLLSRAESYTQLDRQRAKWSPLSSLSSSNYMIVKQTNELRNLLILSSSATDVFPLLEVLRFNERTLQKSSLSGNDFAEQLENSSIVGPNI